ncbi:receptor-transporting protein 3-like [Rhinoderma darwinii]|uniref:receptor-transporting protein 3-like n=1 Tax=Rhinoderma darwinii TaxID=43563 RepID=UPI003F67F8A3
MDAETWEDEFSREIKERRVPGVWVLHEDEGLQMKEKGAQFRQRTFGRFRCSCCKRWWNSAEVHVLFFLNLNRTQKHGTVKMRIFRQECKKCNIPKLEKPKISPENILRITKNIVNRIMQVFYGEKKAKQDLKPEVYSKDMEGPHDKEHCEACKLRICNWQIEAYKKQSDIKTAVKDYSALKKPAIKSKTKGGQWQSDKITSSYVFPTSETYPEYETAFRSTSNYKTERHAAYSSPREQEASNFPVLASLVAGIGALALWYLRR